MPTEKKPVRLLLLVDSQNEAARLISLFRNAGHATRAHRLTSSDDLADALQQTWDLLIAAPSSANLSLDEALAAIRRQGLDLPWLQLLDDNDGEAITAALQQGAQDGVPSDDDERLLLVAERELRNLDDRRARHAAELALREAEKRCQLLLDSSVDAITYVHDGMHIYANRSYVELFGYGDADDLAGMPMIDLIQDCDQPAFKDYLKSYQSSEGQTDLLCTGIRDDGRQFRARMTFSPASYDGEPCTQVVIRAETGNAELEEKLREISSQDRVTGLYNRVHFLELLEQACERAQAERRAATLALLRIDRYAALLGEIGLADCDLLQAACAELLRQHFADDAQLARIADDSFAVLLALSPDQAEGALRELLKKIEGHLFEVAGRTAQITLSIGVAGIGEQSAQAQQVLDRAHRCAEQLSNGNALKLYDPSEELAAAASRGSLAAMLQQALDSNGFQLLFQPIISLHGDEREHYEAQLQLRNPQGETVPPDDFLAAAVQAGLAEKVDRWLLLNAIPARRAPQPGPQHPPVRTSECHQPAGPGAAVLARRGAQGRPPAGRRPDPATQRGRCGGLPETGQDALRATGRAALQGRPQPVRPHAQPAEHPAPPAGRLRQARRRTDQRPGRCRTAGGDQAAARRPARASQADHRAPGRQRQRAVDPVADRGQLRAGPVPAGAQPTHGLRVRRRRRVSLPAHKKAASIRAAFLWATPAQSRPSRSRCPSR